MDHFVDVVFEDCDLSPCLDTDRACQVALGDGGCDLSDGSHLGGQGRRQLVDVVGEVSPRAGRAGHLGLAAQPALDAHLAGDAGHLLREDGEGVGHAVDGVGQLGDLAFRLEGELAPQVAVGDSGHDPGDSAHLLGQLTGHQVDVVGEVFPDTAYAAHLRLAAELAFGAHLARDAGHLRAEGAQLVDHRVHGLSRLEELALQPPALDLESHGLRQVAVGHRPDDSNHLGVGADQVLHHVVDCRQGRRPGGPRVAHRRAVDLTFFADPPAQPADRALEPLVRLNDLVDRVGDLAGGAGVHVRHTCGEVTLLHRREHAQRDLGIDGGGGCIAPCS